MAKSEQMQAVEARATARDTPTSPAAHQPNPPSRAQELLLEFLRDHDAHCPVCGYNVRALTRPICPECKQELVIAVGVMRLHMGWLFAALAPGFFSGIAAFFVLIPITLQLVIGNGRPEAIPIAVDLFGWCSGAFAISLATKRIRFLALSRTRQRWIAIIIWLIHIAALGMFILLGILYG
jgi:hypothetical protein